MKATSWKLGLSTCATNSLERDIFEAYAQNQIEVMEISLPTLMYATIDWNKIRQYAKEYQVQIRSIHLPYYPFETYSFASTDSSVRKHALDLQTQLIARASEIGTNIAVIHPSGEPYTQEERATLLPYARESLAILAENASRYGSVVAVENLPRTCLGHCIAEMRYLISENNSLRICFDTNHLLTENNSDFIRELGDQIINIHVSDYDFIDEKHWLPYEGKNNWVEIVSLLENARYDGPFLYEVPRSKPRQLERRELTFEDYKRNYDACVRKISAPKII